MNAAYLALVSQLIERGEIDSGKLVERLRTISPAAENLADMRAMLNRLIAHIERMRSKDGGG